MEFRIRNLDAQTDANGIQKIGGYINVTERESEILFSKQRGKWFKEVMKKGVFQRALSNNSTVPLLLEHDEDAVLASTGNSSLELREDNIGLRFDAVIEDNTVYENVRNGILNACSFGFRALSEHIEPISNRLEKRFVDSIELLEVSLVKNPAYTGSLVEARAYNENLSDEEKASLEQEIQEIEAEERAKCKKDDSEEKPKDSEKESEDNSEEKDSEDERSKDSSSKEDKCERDIDVNGLASAIVNFLETSNVPIVVPTPNSDSDDDEDSVEVIDCENQEATPAGTVLDDNTKNLIASYVNDLITEKQEAIETAQQNESIAQDNLEDFQEYVNETESAMQENVMQYSAEVLQLRLDLLKLNAIAKGIM